MEIVVRIESEIFFCEVFEIKIGSVVIISLGYRIFLFVY